MKSLFLIAALTTTSVFAQTTLDLDRKDAVVVSKAQASPEQERISCIKAVLPSLKDSIKDGVFSDSASKQLADGINQLCGKPRPINQQ